MLEIVALVGALSLTVTKVVDFFRNLLDKDVTYPKWVWNVAALVVGLAFALGWQLDVSAAVLGLIPALADNAERLEGVSGQILTGFVIGMSAGFWHELLAALSSIAHRNERAAYIEEVLEAEPTVTPPKRRA